jgi:ribosomal protein L24E
MNPRRARACGLVLDGPKLGHDATGLYLCSPRGGKMKKQNHNQKRNPRQTQWAAQFAVASELCKHGYEVSFTMGNSAPFADLMVVSPKSKKMFLVDVKGLYRKNPWQVKPKPKRTDLFYILAYVPSSEPNQFFILTQAEANRYVQSELIRLGRNPDYLRPGLLWTQGAAHKDAWQILPQ